MTGVPSPPAETRAQPERAVGGDGPEALGLGARGVAIVRPSAGAGIGARAADLVPQRGEERLDVDLLDRREAVVQGLVRHRASVAPALGASSIGACASPSRS